jgi:hypothetical protein
LGASALQLIPYGLIATLSPLGLAATLVEMRTGRLQAVGFAVGVVVGQLFACASLVATGVAVTPVRGKAHPTVEGLLAVALGVALLVFAFEVRRRAEPAIRSEPSRSKRALDRLQHVGPVTAVGIGSLLGIGGPKRLVLTALAAAAITAAGQTGTSDAALVVWYTLLATALVWGPVLTYLFLGDAAVVLLDEGIEWFAARRRTITVWSLLVVGAVLVAEGLAIFLAET